MIINFDTIEIHYNSKTDKNEAVIVSRETMRLKNVNLRASFSLDEPTEYYIIDNKSGENYLVTEETYSKIYDMFSDIESIDTEQE